jgi:uncharacterized protein GlcG (DUF336 family)
MMKTFSKYALVLFCIAAPATMMADDDNRFNGSSASGCASLPGYSDLKSALDSAVSAETTGLDLQMWGTIVDRDGIVCAVAFSGANRGAQWPGSRVISAQKANTANSFSLDGLALSTANLYSATQPGGSLFGLQDSNPVDTSVAYKGPSGNYGTRSDPMTGSKIGGVNVFGGGFGLYNSSHQVVGGVGVSGDTSCADHRIGWRVRNTLKLDNLTGVNGVSGDTKHPDNMVFDVTDNPTGGSGKSVGGFGHPHCTATNDGDPTTLPAVQ